MLRAIQEHKNYDQDDYEYLRGKGWSENEILKRWDQELAAGKSACKWEGTPARAKLNAIRYPASA